MTYMPQNAALVVLAFLGTCALLGLAGLTLVGQLISGRFRMIGRVLVPALVLTGLYGGALVAASVTSRDVLLRAGEQKYFCELDCHIAYSVESVTTAAALGEGGERVAAAAGTFWVVTVRTWFDARTINARRRPQGASLAPNPRLVYLVDDTGRRWQPSPLSGRAVAGPSVPLNQALLPGDSYETRLIFELPSDVQHARLLLTDAVGPTLFLIGHERSFLHKKVMFDLQPLMAAS